MLLAMPSSGLEPETSPLPRECSTAELQGQFKWAGLDLTQRRQSQRIYSPPPLTTRAPTPTNWTYQLMDTLCENVLVFFFLSR